MKNKLLILVLAFSLFYVGLNTHVSAKENFYYILEENSTVTTFTNMFDSDSTEKI